MPWAFVVGLFWVDFGEFILDPSHFRKPLLCKGRLTSFASFPKSGCGWKGLGFQKNSPSNLISVEKVKTFWNAKGPKWFPQSLPKTNQQQKLKAFHPRPFHPHPDLRKLAKLVGRSLQSKGFLKCEGSKMVSPKSTQNKPTTADLLFCLFWFECSTNAFDKVCFSCLQEHLYTLYMFKDVTWISIFKYT